MSTGLVYPAPDLSEREKRKKNHNFGVSQYSIDVMEYAIARWRDKSYRIQQMTQHYESYNGIINQKRFTHLNATYGKENIVKYVDYRIARNKLDALVGEFLERPFTTTVTTINPEAISRKMEKTQLLLALHYTKEERNRIKEVTGYEVLGGMEAPDVPEGQTPAQAFSVKEENEIYAQRILNARNDKEKVKMKLAGNLLDVEVTSECYGRVYIGPHKRATYRPINPRNALYEESDMDPYVELSPYKGERRPMFVHDILRTYNISKAKAKELQELVGNPSLLEEMDINNKPYYNHTNGNLEVETYTLEFKTLKPFYTKVMKDKNGGKPWRNDFSLDYYVDNEDQINQDVKDGKYELEVDYKETLWEITKIGHDIYVGGDEKKDLVVKYSNPFEAHFSYLNYLFNTTDGIRVSIQELIENLSRLYNSIRYQMNRELSKAKGRVFTYDRAYLPAGETLMSVMNKVINDGIIDGNSATEGNRSPGDGKSFKDAFQVLDLGLSQNFQMLIMVAKNVEETLDSLTGITAPRMGQTPASQTATNAQSDLSNSRNISEYMFYGFDRYIENLMTLMIETTKVSYIKNPELGETEIGIDGMEFIKMTEHFTDDDYNVSITNGREEKRIRQRMEMLAQISLNSQSIRPGDVLSADMEQSLTAAVKILNEGWNAVQKSNQQMQEQTNQIKGQQIEMQAKEMKKDREDRQQHEKDLVVLKGQVDQDANAASMANEVEADKEIIDKERESEEMLNNGMQIT